MSRIYSVTEINKYIKGKLDSDKELKNIQIQGELSNFKRYPSGHCYFTLKDKVSVLKGVMFKSKALGLKFSPQNGDTVICIGSLTVYERDGIYQLYTDLMLSQGVGNLMLAFEELKQKLEAEGLFSLERKQELPLNPTSIGIITSSAGAAVRDIITVSRRRNPGIRLYLFPVQVQGKEASGDIVRAIEFFNRTKLCDLLIVGRGGGSLEDLWAFNEEPTVRAVAASQLPIISAVGHETDVTLTDFAADKRAATPSQAAELAVPDVGGVKQRVEHLAQLLDYLFLSRLHLLEERTVRAANAYVLKEPELLLADQMQRCDKALEALPKYMEQYLLGSRHKLELAAARLNGLSPLAVLARGYSVTETVRGKLVSSADQVGWGEEIVTVLNDGKIFSQVQEIRRNEEHGYEKG